MLRSFKTWITGSYEDEVDKNDRILENLDNINEKASSVNIETYTAAFKSLSGEDIVETLVESTDVLSRYKDRVYQYFTDQIRTQYIKQRTEEIRKSKSSTFERWLWAIDTSIMNLATIGISSFVSKFLPESFIMTSIWGSITTILSLYSLLGKLSNTTDNIIKYKKEISDLKYQLNYIVGLLDDGIESLSEEIYDITSKKDIFMGEDTIINEDLLIEYKKTLAQQINTLINIRDDILKNIDQISTFENILIKDAERAKLSPSNIFNSAFWKIIVDIVIRTIGFMFIGIPFPKDLHIHHITTTFIPTLFTSLLYNMKWSNFYRQFSKYL